MEMSETMSPQTMSMSMAGPTKTIGTSVISQAD